MACKNCGKDKKKTKEKHDLLYIMNPNCGWCKKSDPVVDELRKDGYKITTLDVNKPEEAERANEAKAKHKAQCGTPLFLDAETGNMACGFKEKDVLEKWAKGEELPAPPPRPQQPNDAPNKQPQIENVKLEYIWLDGSSPSQIRSKSKYQRMNMGNIGNNILRMIPSWSFDGSSTNQADTENSDCILKPVKAVPNPLDPPSRNNGSTVSWIILCEVYTSDNTPHESNTRTSLIDAVKNTESDMVIGFEQEYLMTNPVTGKPLGWEKYENETPPSQGDYYCGVGTANGRSLVDTHARLCNQAGISIFGTNAEVMLSQWEYQTAPKPAVMSADDVVLSRYILQRLAEDMNIAISYEPKPLKGDWNGSGGHINFSTGYMRSESDIAYLTLLCSSMEQYHEEALLYYGINNDERLTGKHETSSVDEFSWGESDRSSSVRIPVSTVQSGGKGYIEDRRPAANIDPYEAYTYLVNTISKINKELLITT